MYNKRMTIEGFDDELWTSIQQEEQRQEDHIELIASENYASPRVMQAQGSMLTNKYAEGYPGKRYYGGCEYVDMLSSWRLTVLRSCSVQIMPTYNLMQVHKPMQPFTLRC